MLVIVRDYSSGICLIFDQQLRRSLRLEAKQEAQGLFCPHSSLSSNSL